MNKSVKIILAILAGFIVSFATLLLLQKESKAPSTTKEKGAGSSQTTSAEPETQEPASSDSTEGRYTSYSTDKVYDEKYSESIIFFYAPWCPECRAFKKSILDGQIPDGTQFLEVDYDGSTDLKKHFGVTLQSTFVRVNRSGDLQKKWVGYGKDKSLATILENVK